MQTARRLYLYAISGITLAVIATGLVLLLRVALGGFFPDPYAGDYEAYDNSREQLSQAIAMLGVGTPVWAVHWWLVQRGLREGRPERDAERGWGIRAFYITGILLVSLLVWVPSATALLKWFTTDALNAVPEYTYLDPLGSVTSGLVGLAIWIYHGLVRRRDLAAGPVSDAAAWIPRLYLYGVAIGAGFIALASLGSIVTSAFGGYAFEGDVVYGRYSLIEQAIMAIAWGLVWLGHWWYSTRLARSSDWRGVDERMSRTRLAAFFTIIVAAFVATLGDVADVISSAIRVVVPEPGVPGDGDLRFVFASLISAVAWGIVWYAHMRALRREPAATDPLRALHQERLVSHGISAAALAIGAAGAGWLLGLALDVVLGGQRTTGDAGSLRYEFSQWLPVAVLGLGAWAWFWRGVVARRRADPSGEAHSTIRRTFLYLTLGVGLVVALASAAVILYRFVGIVVGAGIGGNLVSDLSTPLGTLITAGAVLLYHGLALRGDQRLVAEATPEPAPVQPDASQPDAGQPDAVTTEPAQRRAFELVGPAEADLDAALVAARAALPLGIEIVSPET